MSENQNDLPVSVWSGVVHIGSVALAVHVLSNGERVVEAESVERFLDALTGGADFEDADLGEFVGFLDGRGVPSTEAGT